MITAKLTVEFGYFYSVFFCNVLYNFSSLALPTSNGLADQPTASAFSYSTLNKNDIQFFKLPASEISFRRKVNADCKAFSC